MNKHKELAGEFVESLKIRPEVEGIVFLGGLGKRCHFDEYSDVDLGVFVQVRPDSGAPEWLPNFEFDVYCGPPSEEVRISFNVHQLDIMAEGVAEWPDTKKEAFENAIIAFDRAGRVSELLAKKVGEKGSALDELIEIAVKLPPYTDINPRRQAIRGHTLDAHQILNQGVRLILDAVYQLNQRYTPHDKWRFGEARSLTWLPIGFDEAILEATLVHQMTTEDVERRVRSLSAIVVEVLGKIEERCGDSLPHIYDYACWRILGRQLLQRPFSSALVEALRHSRPDFSHSDLRYISGFVNFYLVRDLSELENLASSSANFHISGLEQCRRAVKELRNT